MIKKKLLILAILLLFVISVLNVNTTQVSAVKYPVIYIDPATTLDPTLTPGESFTISIKTDYEGSDIHAYQFHLTYDPSVLKGISVTNGDLITKEKIPGSTVNFYPGKFDNIAGKLPLTGASFFYTKPNPAPMTYGPGILANVTFEVVDNGTSDIILGPSTGLGSFTEGGYGDPYLIIYAKTMPDHIQHGFFSNLYAIYIDPATTLDTTLMPNKNYTVSIKTNYNGTDIWGWEFTLTYDPDVLEGINVTNGDLITKEKNETATFKAGTFNNTLGKLPLTGASFQYPGTPLPVVSGPGTLANVTFEVVSTGVSNITLGPETKLIGANATTGEKYDIIDATTMPDQVYHGYFDNTLHDIAVTNVTASPDKVDPGDPVSINATVTNEGDYNETFTVTVYADMDTTVIGDEITLKTQTVDTWTGDNATTTFNTTQKPVVPDSEEIYVNQTIMTRTTQRTDTWTGDNMTKVFNTTQKPVVPDSEEVYVNETLMIRDVNYTINYTTGNITFTTAPEEDVEIRATYQYVQYTINYTTGNITFTTAPEEGVEVKATYQYNVYLTARNSTTLTINWNTTGVRSGIYNITARASVVLGEKNTTNNVGSTKAVIRGPPVASFTYSPEKPVVDEVVTFNASASYDPDPDGAIVSYEWNFGDGNVTSGDYQVINHTYNTAGNYTVNLTVTDLENKTDTTTKNITIGKLSSTITISASLTTVPLDESTTISGSITPTRAGATVTIWYRLDWEAWNTVNVTTNEESQYTYTWTPATAGTYKLKASWPGDNNTHPAESSTITVEVTKIHDIAVANVTPSSDTVKIGEQVSINVTVANEGHYTETFNVTVYANTTLIGTLTDEILISGSSTTFTITWDTTDIAKGDYTISANATVLESTVNPQGIDDDLDDNTYTDGIVTVQEAPAPDILIYAAVAAVAIIVIAAIALYTLKVRKTKST